MVKKRFEFITLVILIATFGFGSLQIKAAENITKEEIQSALYRCKNTNKKLTIMLYSDADNNLEEDLLQNIKEIKESYVDNPNLNLIVLIDRIPGYSSDAKAFGEDFIDTRMYKIEHEKTERIDGNKQFPEITKTSNYEADMGDAETLKKFIDSCKANYPADEYELIIANHGNGARLQNEGENINNSRQICCDMTSKGDYLYTAELTDKLTNKESVDLLAYDACFMGTVEGAYQYRPGNGSFQAKYMVASAPIMWGKGFNYKGIFNRLNTDGGDNGEEDLTLGGKEKYYDPSKITPKELGSLIVEEQRDLVNEANNNTQSLSCFDLSKMGNVKKSVDKMSRALWLEKGKAAVEKLRGTVDNTLLLDYFYESDATQWLVCPYFDLYDLCEKISKSNNFSANIKYLAKKVMSNVDKAVLYSFGGSQFPDFKEGKNGLSIFLPDGSKVYKDLNSGYSYTAWQAQRWYNSVDVSAFDSDFLYGKLSWCKDGQTTKINDVGNWFELLDSWFDTSNNSDGGFNWYQW